MENHEIQNTYVEQTDAMKNAAGAFQAQAHKAGEQSMAAAKDFGDNVRAMMEKNLAETRIRYGKAKTAIEEASTAVEASFSAARAGATELNAKAIEAMKSDAESNFDLMTAAVSAKSMSELVTLNTEFVRKRFEEATTRAKDFSEFARKVADETASPIRDQAAKTFKFSA